MLPLTILCFALSIITAVRGVLGWPHENAVICAVIAAPFFALLAIAPLVFAIDERKAKPRRLALGT